MPAGTTAKRPVVFVHGLWLHAESWNPWVAYFHENGYEAVAATWPGDGVTAECTRRNAAAVAGFGVTEIAAHVAAQLTGYSRKPILIGHSFGGLLAQNLLGRDLAAAAIAIAPAPIKGVWDFPLSALKSSFPVLGNPFNLHRAVSLTEAQFRYGFANAVPLLQAQALYRQHAMPAPARPLFQAATAMLHPRAATRVNVANVRRGPLLLMSGGSDHTVPPALVKSALRMYRHSTAATGLRDFPDRGHSLVIDSGWRDIADACLEWLKVNHL